MNPENTHSPQVKPLGPAVEVPVYNCIVLVGPGETSGVRARVANLAGIETTARTEREALQHLIPAFKQRLSDLRTNGESIPWLDPPSPADAGEQQRLIAVHL